jgi:hypothetical protein
VLTDAGRQRLLRAAVLPPDQTWTLLCSWLADEGCGTVVLGDGTGSAGWRRRLEGLREPPLVVTVDERDTTLAARQRYWQLFPPRGLRRLLPRGLRQPPRAWDDVVAQLLLERWLGHPLRRDGLDPTETMAGLRRTPAP